MCDSTFGPFFFVEKTTKRDQYVDMLECVFFPQNKVDSLTTKISCKTVHHHTMQQMLKTFVVQHFLEDGLAGKVQFPGS
jgi:hypothetical protein